MLKAADSMSGFKCSAIDPLAPRSEQAEVLESLGLGLKAHPDTRYLDSNGILPSRRLEPRDSFLLCLNFLVYITGLQ